MIKKTYTPEQASRIASDMSVVVEEFKMDEKKALDFHLMCCAVVEKSAQSKKFKIAFKRFLKFIEDTEIRGEIQ